VSFAITIDSFDGDYELTSSQVAGSSKTGFSTSSNAAGGDRQFTVVQKSSGKGATRLATSGSSLRFTLEANEGEGIVVWDADRNPNAFNNAGLGSIDLTQGAGDALIIPLEFFDLAFGKPVFVRVTVFDSTNSNKWSEIAIRVDQFWNQATPFPITVPFSLLQAAGSGTVKAPVGSFSTTTTLGSAGAASLLSVGAVRLHIIGDAADMFIGALTTNGRCVSVPNPSGKVLDDCGVCFESADANAGKDLCGVCFKGPPGYDYTVNKVFDACGLCPSQTGYAYPDGTKDSCGICLHGQPPYSYEDQKDDCGLCPSVSNYGKAKDPCGVCFGDGTSCADCSGTPNGSAKIDQCGVCQGDGTTCLDCAGVPNGSAALDVCGVCGGDGTSCLDCNGVVNGPSVRDACGVCGGNAKDPSACASVPEACVVVPATKKVKEFERSLVTKAKAVRSRFKSELARAKRTKCSINAAPAQQIVQSAFLHITSRSKQIFLTGVEVCGDSCITTSYADEVQALMPEFKAMQKNTLNLARQVKKCYAELGIARPESGGARGVETTLGNVNQGLQDLIRRCRDQKVCPPKS
jgi:hypothetical protein